MFHGSWWLIQSHGWVSEVQSPSVYLGIIVFSILKYGAILVKQFKAPFKDNSLQAT